jgi:hypothetical protein
VSNKFRKDVKALIIHAVFIERTDGGTIEEVREDGKSPIESSEPDVRNRGCETGERLHRSQSDIERALQICIRSDWCIIVRASVHGVLDLLHESSKMRGSIGVFDDNACKDAVLIKIPFETFSEK